MAEMKNDKKTNKACKSLHRKLKTEQHMNNPNQTIKVTSDALQRISTCSACGTCQL